MNRRTGLAVLLMLIVAILPAILFPPAKRPDEIEKVLTPFQQVEHHLNRSHQGTGLGLPLAKRLTELHGGTFAIESKVDQGTTVRITLPGDR